MFWDHFILTAIAVPGPWPGLAELSYHCLYIYQVEVKFCGGYIKITIYVKLPYMANKAFEGETSVVRIENECSQENFRGSSSF